MNWIGLELNLSPEQKRDIIRNFQQIVYYLEGTLNIGTIGQYYNDLENDLTQALENLNIQLPTDKQTILNLRTSDNQILNLPWRIAQYRGRQLQELDNVFLCRSLPHKELKRYKAFALPLRILVVFSAPTDVTRLSYEEERFMLTEALDSLLGSGTVEVEFAPDAMLSTVQAYLNERPFHILHFSGHSVFDKESGKAFLAMEDEYLQVKNVEAQDFARVVAQAKYPPALVVLSSCQSAQGKVADTEKLQQLEQGLAGLTNNLLMAGIPAVIGMSMSITDEYATLFAKEFYHQLGEKQDLHSAFKTAISYIKVQEFNSLKAQAEKGKNVQLLPLQWIIPQLYVSARIENIVDWSLPVKKYYSKPIHKYKNFIIARDDEFRFIGRRNELRKALNALREKKTVIITGQGGLGKTTLAEQIFYQLSFSQDLHVFVFRHTDRLPQYITQALTEFLKAHKPDQLKWINQTLKDKTTEPEKLFFLRLNAYLSLLKECQKPIYFLFDNLETFLDIKTHKINNHELEQAIDLITQNFPTVITCRYPVPDKPWLELNLNTVGKFDFYEKIKQTDIQTIINYASLVQKEKDISVNKIRKLFYRLTGGNYRMLEMINAIMVKNFNREKLEETITDEQKFIREFLKIDLALEQINENLLFDKLFGLLSHEQKQILQALSYFVAPVPVEAITMQLDLHYETIDNELQYLRSATLCEKIDYPAQGYQVNELVKQLLKDKPLLIDFSHQRAAEYFEQNNRLIPAFEHYLKAKNKQKVAELGLALANLFYNENEYKISREFAERAYKLLGDKADWKLLTRIGQNYDSLGDYEKALEFYEKALDKAKQYEDKAGEGVTLNNISGIYWARGDYETALKYLEQSLEILRQIGDKAGEAYTLFNIGMTYLANLNQPEKGLILILEAYKINQQVNDYRLAQAIENLFKQLGIPPEILQQLLK